MTDEEEDDFEEDYIFAPDQAPRGYCIYLPDPQEMAPAAGKLMRGLSSELIVVYRHSYRIRVWPPFDRLLTRARSIDLAAFTLDKQKKLGSVHTLISHRNGYYVANRLMHDDPMDYQRLVAIDPPPAAAPALAWRVVRKYRDLPDAWEHRKEIADLIAKRKSVVFEDDL